MSILFSRRAPVLTMLYAVLALSGCGQKGDLYIPASPAGAQRASLPDSLKPGNANTPPSRPEGAASAATR